MRRKADEETAKLSQVVQCVSGLPPPSRCQLSDYQLLGLPLPLQVAGASYQSGWFNQVFVACVGQLKPGLGGHDNFRSSLKCKYWNRKNKSLVRWAALGGQDLTTGEELIVWKSDNLETHFFGAGCLPFLGIKVMIAKKNTYRQNFRLAGVSDNLLCESM